jgi:hypothetical protein
LFLRRFVMRLHDIQVTLSSADIANRYQVQHQQLAQAAQAQEALIINARAELKKSQSQQTGQEQGAKAIEEKEERLKQWKKGGRGGEHEKDAERPAGQKKQGQEPGAEHIIDITV